MNAKDRPPYENVDEYIKWYPKDVQEILNKIRKIMEKEMPDAEQVISYGILTFKLFGKYVVYFAGYEKHVSVYPIGAVPESLEREIKPYVAGRGTLKFPLNEPIPFDLIEKFVKHRVKVARESKDKKKQYA